MITWALILVGFVNTVLGFVVFRQAQKNLERYIFLALLLASAVWAWGIAAFLLASSVERAQMYVDIYYVAALSIAVLMLAYALYDKGVRQKLVYALLSLPVIAWAVFLSLWPQSLVKVVSLDPNLSSRVEIAPLLYILYALTFIAVTLPALDIFYRNALDATGRLRRRRLLIANSMLVSGVFGMLFNLILPGLYIYDLIGLGPLFSIAFTLAATYSIVHYSMFDLKQSFMRSFVYILTFATTIAVFGLLSWAVSNLLAVVAFQPEARTLANLVVFAIAAALFEPIRRHLSSVSDDVFLKNEYDFQEILGKVGHIVSDNIEIDALSTRLLTLFRRAFGASFTQLALFNRFEHTQYRKTVGKGPVGDMLQTGPLSSLLSADRAVLFVDREDDSKQATRALKEAKISLVVRLRNVDDVIGYLFIGTKNDGSSYSRRDAELLSITSNEIALAAENSMRYGVIKSFNDTLEDKIDEATAELRTTNKKLRIMDQTKDEFISLTSHQLRTPLTTIKGYLSMLLDGDVGKLTPQQQRLVEEAFNSSQRMVHLISDFLNISRIQTGKFMIELTDVNLADVLDEEIQQLHISAVSRQIKLDYEKPQNFPMMPMDEGKIRQVMMNFIDNAIYYSPSGTTIRIILSYTTSAVEFKVIDQGIGVPKAEQHKLFAKFSRASNARKQRPDGTGIGLFMAKKVIVALGGAIIFKSEEGKGSTFGFRLNR